MPTYVIGDVHACFIELKNLLVKIKFNSAQDTLWFTGDLVNRGDFPIETLEFIKSLANRAICVLGNHDLALLAQAHNKIVHPPEHSSFEKINNYRHKDALLTWLSNLPLLHYDEKFNAILVHAGLPPQWELNTALSFAKEVEQILQSDKKEQLFTHMFDNSATNWEKNLTGWKKFSYIINCYTRMRFCNQNGKLELQSKAELECCPPGFRAWFQFAQRKTANTEVYFGHWAALKGTTNYHNVFAMDTGCAWGNSLSAIRIEDKQIFAVPCIKRIK